MPPTSPPSIATVVDSPGNFSRESVHLTDAARALLKASESRYRRLFETAQDGILLLNAKTGQIEDVNPYLIDMLGYSHTEFLGKKLWEVGSFTNIKESKEMFSRLQITGYVRYEDLPLKTKAGINIDVEFVSNSYDCEGVKIIQCNIRNITDRRIAEKILERHKNLYAALSQCNKAIVHCTSEKELFQKICRVAVELGGIDMAWVVVMDPKTQTLQQVASFGDGVGYLKDIELPIDADCPYGGFPGSTVIRDGLPYWCQNLLSDPTGIPEPESIQRAGWSAVASLPLKKNGINIGAFNVFSMEINAFDELARNLLVEMASDISQALDAFVRESERNQSTEELRIASIAFESQEGMMITDFRDEILRVNQAFTAMTGYSSDEAVGKTASLVRSAVHDDAFYSDINECVKRDGVWQGEVWNRRKNGEVFPTFLTMSAVMNGNDDVTHYVKMYTDISHDKAAAEEIQRLAFYDYLTELPNRRLLMDRLQQALASSKRSGLEGALLFLDLDHFKTINDIHGHDIGDLLLKQVAQRLTSFLREGDTVARLGGDEFVMVLSDLNEHSIESASRTVAIGEKILEVISKPYQLDALVFHCTASIGMTLFSNHEQGADELLKHADIAMYHAKKAGRNVLRFFDPKMQEVINARANLENELRLAPEKHQFQLYYQVQVDDWRRPLGAEALIRWMHPDRGLLLPAQFIPLAEESDLILSIGQWVLEKACSQLQAWQKNASTHDLVLAVNMSSRQFRQADFVTQLKFFVQRYGINPRLLRLELTEHLFLENIQETIAVMNALKEVGIQFSLDDFGTGYSSLQYLKLLPLAQLKIDKSFVHDINLDNIDRAIVRTIIAMAHGMKLDVIAEGVESEEQLRLLHNKGCASFQGYLFGKPVPIEQFESSLL
jgi:diguanylate cyclase (GGDEF)-like protein/PAS domain S-box-containing protein